MKNNTHYELTFIVDGNIPENEHADIVKNVKNLLSEIKATIISEMELGRKKLSYPIKKSQKGNYFSIEFDVEPGLLKPFEIKLKLEKAILRFLIIKKPKNAINKEVTIAPEDKVEAEEKPKKVKAEKTEKAKTPKEEPVVEEVKEEVKEEVVVEEKKEKKAKEENDSKATKDELDAKLDEILNKESF